MEKKTEYIQRIFDTALKAVKQVEPNYLHMYFSGDSTINPEKMHPAFFGSFDWHSCVHSFYTIVRILKEHEKIENAAEAIAVLKNRLTEDNIKEEMKQVNGYLQNFEIPYGFCWMLMLSAELQSWESEVGKLLCPIIKPIEELLRNSE